MHAMPAKEIAETAPVLHEVGEEVGEIVRRRDGWYVLSRKGRNMGGPYWHRGYAVKRQEQVEYFKHGGSKAGEGAGEGPDEQKHTVRVFQRTATGKVHEVKKLRSHVRSEGAANAVAKHYRSQGYVTTVAQTERRRKENPAEGIVDKIKDALTPKDEKKKQPVKGACLPTIKIERSEHYNECLARAEKLGPIKSPAKVYELLGPSLEKEEQEVLIVVPLDVKYRLRGGVVEAHRGSRSRVEVAGADILRAVLITGASYFILVHCHPSGKATASPADKKLTTAVGKAAHGIDVVLLDHIVIGRGQYYSIREKKLYRVKK
jgi:RadC-like JAB domain